MKIRKSFDIDYEAYQKFVSITPNYKKSTIVQSLIEKYLEDGIIKTDWKLSYPKAYACFTLNVETWIQVKKQLRPNEWSIPKLTLNKFMEFLIRGYLEELENG